MFILGILPLNALLRVQAIKLDSMQVPSLTVRSARSLTDHDIEVIKKSKFRILYGHPEAFVGKLRKLLDSDDIRQKMKAVVVDEAHLIEEWLLIPNLPFILIIVIHVPKTLTNFKGEGGNHISK